ncbi:hypothetical protein [Pseudomonas atacamensis]|uniref:Uncharacterized protein n=1 Tax=Pseudomonas iranensis TaxID=2745503 RepID=A0AAU7F4A8_9PSED
MEWTFVLNAITTHLPSANTVAAFAGAGSAFAAVWTIKKSASARENERLLGNAVTTLERAYRALCGQSDSSSLPPSDRVAWLTAARLIEDYKDAKKRLKDPLIIQECEAHEEHWRHQFYLKLTPLSMGHLDYYQGLYEISAIIVHAFASWPTGKADPVDRYASINEARSELKIDKTWTSLLAFLKQQG